MDKFVFATGSGVVVQSGDKKVVSATDCSGQKRLISLQEKNKIIFWHFPFVRGLQYFFCGIFAQIQAFFNVYDLCGKQKVKESELKIFYTKKVIAIALSLLLGVLFAALVLGYVCGQLGLLIVDFKHNQYLRNFVILCFKLLFFALFLLCLRAFPSFCEFLKFYRAGAVAMVFSDTNKAEGKFCPPNPLNFLNYVVFVFVLAQSVITLVGADFGFAFNLLFHLCIFLVAAGVGFEFLNLLCLCKAKWVRCLVYPTAILLQLKPSRTHIETASIAFMELGMQKTQKGREFMTLDTHAFAVVYNEVKNKLAAAGINEKSETDWLIATVLGKNRAEIKLVASITEKQYQDIQKATARRAKGESLDNIFGFTEFYGLRFDVNKKVLTPRMETELLVEQVLKIAKNISQPKILDLGTGSGAIAVAVAKNNPYAVVTAVDVSKSALEIAGNNAKKNDVKIEFLHTNCFEGLKRKRKFDIIVSNPPYIATEDIKTLDKNVRECDPILALDGGQDGLDFYRKIIPNATKRLFSGGTILFEVGKGQAAAVRKILRENGFEEIKTIKDYNKIERIVCGKFK